MKLFRWLGATAIAAMLAAALLSIAPSGHVAAQGTGCQNQFTASTGLSFATNGAGATCDARRNNFDTGVLLTLAAQGPGTVTSATVRNYDGSALMCVVVTSAVSGSDSTVYTINGFDVASGTFYPILTSAAVTATGTVVLRVGAYTAVTNLTANSPAPASFNLVAVESGASSTATATVGCTVQD